MARVTKVRKPGDYPASPDEATRKALNELFETLFPGVENPEIDSGHDGVAIAALNPGLAMQMARMSGFMSLEMPWCERRDLRDLAIQTVNRCCGCDYAFNSRVPNTQKLGISAEQQQALASWQSSDLFDDEQRLVIEYSYAVVRNTVSDELFNRVATAYGEKGAVEFTSLVAFFACWAMVLNATRPGP